MIVEAMNSGMGDRTVFDRLTGLMLLEMKSVQKRFGGVTALRDGNLSVREGEVHLLMGENGAGKSTLMKIVAGMQGLDEGEMLFRGQRVHFSNPKEAAAHGIAMVHQESLLAPHLSVGENIFLGREETSGFGVVNRSAMMARATALIEERLPVAGGLAGRKIKPCRQAVGGNLPRRCQRQLATDFR